MSNPHDSSADDDDAIRPFGGPSPAERPPEVRPGPSIFFPGMRQVRVQGEEPAADDATPLDGEAQTRPADEDAPGTPLSGREQTMLGDGQPAPTPLSGREQTMLGGTGQPPPTPLSGREQTMLGGDGQPPPTPLSGREQTMLGGTGQPPPTPLSGREQTMLGGAEQPPPTPLSGREQTMLGGDEADGRTPPTLLGPRPSGGPPPTSGGKPRTGVGSSAAFDAGWHLGGRKGPFTGQTWGDFEIGGMIGEGGMGIVYRAIQRSLRRRVALKLLPPNLAHDTKLLQRFHLEASTASKLSSPHVVQVYAIGEHEGNHYYAMEYVEGTDLYDTAKDRREAGRPLSANEAADFVLQAARGLAEAGRFGIVHRDIKPPNMMIDRKGLLKIADFGIVKVLGEHQLTMTGQAVGTPAYCSPEQGRGDAEVDQRSDLYSLGVVFYELLCGRKPFEATTPNALIYKHCFEEPELPQKLDPEIPDSHQAVVLKLLQKKPENRYGDADELVRDLEGIKTGAMLASALANIRGTGASEAKREQMNWLQRNLLAVLVAATALVAVAGGGGYWYLTTRGAADIASATAELEARAAQERVARELKPALASLDQVAPLPADVGALLDELGDKAPDDVDLERWRAKVQAVQDLATEVGILDGGADGPLVRRAAAAALERYEGLVGTQDPSAVRWRGRLQQLQQEEESLRSRIRALLAGTVDQPARDALDERITRLAALSGDDDGQVQQVRSRIAAFDEQVAQLVAQLLVLDEPGATVTEAQRLKLQAAHGQLLPLLGTGDARLQRWGLQLDQAGGLVERLRLNLGTALGAQSRPPLAVVDQVETDLQLLGRLVDEEDRDLLRWQAQINASRQRVAELQQQLQALEPRLDAERSLPAPLLTPVRQQIEELRHLAGDGDTLVLDWTIILQRSQGLVTQLQNALERCSPAQPEPITVAERLELEAALVRLEGKAGIEADQAEQRRRRLASEARRVTELQRRVAVLDSAIPFTAELESELLRLAEDLGEDHPDIARWLAKRARILDLRRQLAVLDGRQAVPDNLDGLFESLIAEVGGQAPEVQRWEEKVRAIAETKAALVDLDRPVSIPADAARRLATLTELVGADDPAVQRWREKLHRVATLDTGLAACAAAVAWGPEPLAAAEAACAELLGLVGDEDPALHAHARRLEELAGPPAPAWARSSGRDQAGAWIELALGEVPVRFRHVPPGRFQLGSPDDEPGRDADEVAVAVRLAAGFWLAETETTQALWAALMTRNPSRFAGRTRPVDRVSLAEVTDFCARLDATLGTAAGFRLPSEAEWEYACRAGSNQAWQGRLEDLAWFAANSGQLSQAVAQRYANTLGLFDMHGNLAEWCRDGYHAYPTTACTDPLGSPGPTGVARGGCWGDPPARLRAANRIPIAVTVRSCYLGFRLAAPLAWPEGQGPDGSRLLARLGVRRNHQWRFDLAGISVTVVVPDTSIHAAPAAATPNQQGAVGEDAPIDDREMLP